MIFIWLELASSFFIKAGQKTLDTRVRQQFHNPENFQIYFDKAMKQTRREGFWESLVSIIINYPDNLLDILHYYPHCSPNPLIIWGEDDKITEYVDSKKVVSVLKGELLTFSNAGHAVHYEYPEKVNRKIIDFLGCNP